MSLQNISPLPRYTGRLETLSSDLAGRTPSVARVAQTGLPVPIEPIVEVGTMQPVSQTITNRTPGPLKTMALSNAPPSSVGPELPRQGEVYNNLLERLLAEGYLVQYRLYDGQVLLYFMALTRAGDPFLIRVDLPQARSGLGRVPEVQMERRPVLSVVPQEIKVGALQCLNYDICGAAFVCDGNLCLAERPNDGLGQQVQVVEEQFALKSPISGARLGRSIVAYPVVQLSDLLSDLKGYEVRIAEASRIMADLGYEILSQDTHSFLQALDEVRIELLAADDLSKNLRTDLDQEIEKLTQIYSELRDLHPSDLPDEQQARYYLLLKTLADKKRMRRDFIDAAANAQRASNLVRSVPAEIHSQIDPVLESYQQTGGQF